MIHASKSIKRVPSSKSLQLAYDDDDDSVTGSSVPTENQIKEDPSRIRMFRIMVTSMLVMTAVVTIVANRLLTHEETRNFEIAYAEFASTLANAALKQQRSLINSLKGISNEITAYAQMNNQLWPYVVLPFFESFAMSFFDHSAGEFVAVNNLVYNHERENFIDYTTKHYKGWVHESHMIKFGNLDALDQDETKYNPFFTKKVGDGYEPDDIDREYYSIRTSQSPPMLAYGPLLNLNVATLGNIGDVIDAVLSLKNETLVTAIKPFLAVPAEEHQNFHTDSNADNPHSFMLHPIYERVAGRNDDVHANKIVGTVTASVAWDASMQNLLPENVKGILCVVRNTCNQSFTYAIDGPNAYYLGKGDHHDTKYDDYEVKIDLSLHTHPSFAATPGHCQYTMHIFPTDRFKEDYTTAMPVTFSVVVAASFGLVAIGFFLYDWYMQQRNNELSRLAMRSDNLVASLFPRDMKDEILERQIDSGGRKNKTHYTASNEGQDYNDDTNAIVARQYPSTTVMFGDLSGFTAWSSDRTPAQVFDLLEKLYGAFDEIARHRKVFKVETIGDCYVAATGLPKPQPDHAVRMMRFASDCMAKTNVLTAELAERLGEDTMSLRLRIGLHSGSVTGGVLRGDKSRFQLFGDTMNTASRMETNGEPGRIHLSRAVADILIDSGRKSWVTPREDKVIAKGKGEMETFWGVIISNASSCSSDS